MAHVLHSSWPPVCSPFTDGESYTSCFALWSHYIWAGSYIIPISPLFKFWFPVPLRAWGIQRKVPSPHLWPASASVMPSSYQHANLPFPLCQANPTTQSSSGCEMAWWPSCNLPVWNSPSLCQLSFFLGLGITCGSGLLGLVPKDFPDPNRQKQRRFQCSAFLYNMFIIMLLSFF